MHTGGCAVTLDCGSLAQRTKSVSLADASGEQSPHTVNEPLSLSCPEMAVLRENDDQGQCQRRTHLSPLAFHIFDSGQITAYKSPATLVSPVNDPEVLQNT